MVRKIGIDLGTSNSLVWIPGKGVVLNEPSVVAVDIVDNRVLAVGNEAHDMLGRTPEGIRAVRPIREGAIADYRMTEALIGSFFNRVMGKIRLFRPDCLISVPAAINSTERRAVIEVVSNVGAKNVFVVKEPILAALGANIAINVPSGSMIVDIGGGTTEVAVLSLGGIVNYSSTRTGGQSLTDAIANHIKFKYGVAVSEQIAEDIKINIGSALPLEKDKMHIRGRDVVTGLPKDLEITSEEITRAMQGCLKDIIQTIKNSMQDTPPELAGDIIGKGIVLTGGGALLRHMDKLVEKLTGVNCTVGEDPLFSVVKGTGVMLESLDTYKRVLNQKR
jgi:rod shape-determining protein MreB